MSTQIKPSTKARKAANRRRSDGPPEMAPDLISRSDAARLRGVDPSAVTLACRPRGALFEAVRGKKLLRTHPAFVAWLEQAHGAEARALMLRKRKAEVERLEARNAREAGAYISRELVQTHLIGMIDAGNRRLLEASKTITRRAYAAAHGGVPVEDAERMVSEVISSVLAGVKTTAVRLLRGE